MSYGKLLNRQIQRAKTTLELSCLRDYPCEEHFVTTSDGYIIQIFRIPNQENVIGSSPLNSHYIKQTILLIPSLCQSSNVFVCHPRKELNLAFYLSDLGFDVWIANFRGSQYGLTHTSLNSNSDAFWDFSLDQLAKYDIPSIISLVLTKAHRTFIKVMGLGLGATLTLNALSTNEELNLKVHTLYALSPILSQQEQDIFGRRGFLTEVSTFTNAYPRFSSPLVRILLKHIYGSHLDQLGTVEDAIAIQAHALSSTSTQSIQVNPIPIHNQHLLQILESGTKTYKKAEPYSLFRWSATQPSKDAYSVSYPYEHILSRVVCFGKSTEKKIVSHHVSLLFYYTMDEFEPMDYLWNRKCPSKIWSILFNDLMNSVK